MRINKIRLTKIMWEIIISEYSRFHKLFAVVFLDIDDFRKFNNQYGHDIRDEVLKNIAQNISKNTRKSDLFGR